MAGADDPHDPRARLALEGMRVIAAGTLLALLAHEVVTRGPFQTLVFLGGMLGAVLGLPFLRNLLKKGE